MRAQSGRMRLDLRSVNGNQPEPPDNQRQVTGDTLRTTAGRDIPQQARVMVRVLKKFGLFTIRVLVRGRTSGVMSSSR
jgi:hypothetical protein